MTQAAATSAAKSLKASMERWGLRCSIELQAGRGVDPWGVYTKYHRMWHHTVSTYKPGGSLTPVLWLVKEGRPDVVGPLCNGYLGFDLVYRIICMGEANHPGLGGPITIDGVHIPENSARKPTWGTEVEGGIQTWEEIDRLGPDMLQAMGRADCALAEWSGRPLTSQMEHKTWAPDRKVDRKDFDAARVRGIALTTKWFATQEDDMPLNETDKTIISNLIRQELYGSTSAHSQGVTPIIRNEVRAVLMEMFPDGYVVAFGKAMRDAVGVTKNVDGEAAAQVRARANEGALKALETAGLYVPDPPA